MEVTRFKYLVTICIFAISLNSYALKELSNLGFEKSKDSKASGWAEQSNSIKYEVNIDKDVYKSGAQSLSIKQVESKGLFTLISYSIPANYVGKKITIKGFLKSENINDGSGGFLWLQNVPSASSGYTYSSGIDGTKDWELFEVSLPFVDLSAKKFSFGAMLYGDGKLWVDELTILIDDVPIEKASVRQQVPALLDNEFDDGSNLLLSNLSSGKYQNLVLLGKVWGFLKYHHPAIANGKYQWDYELLRVLPSYIAAKSNQNRDQLILEWIDNLGAVAKCIRCIKDTKNAHIRADLDWISNSGINKELKNKLNYIHANRAISSHFYINTSSQGQPFFDNELSYSNMPFPDAGFRLVALFRYWNIVQYYSPYKHYIDKDWNEVLLDMLPVFINASSELEYELAITKLISEVQDTHALIIKGDDKIEEWRGIYHPPFLLRMVEGQMVIVDFYTNDPSDNREMSNKTGMQIGDIITHVNGKKIEELINLRLSHYIGSNYTSKMLILAADLLRSNKSNVKIQYTRDNKSVNKTLSLYKLDEINHYSWFGRRFSGDSFQIFDGKIGYLNLAMLEAQDIESVKKDLFNTESIIIDIRHYPKSFVPFILGALFVDTPTPFVKFSKFNINTPGEFLLEKPLEITNAANTYQGKLVILINEFTWSSAEYTAMAFKASKNSIFIGNNSVGADGDVATLKLPGGIYTGISGNGIYYPDGTKTQRIGILPDIRVLPTVEGVRQGKDEVLDKALELLKMQ